MDALYNRCLAASAALHVGLFVVANSRVRLDMRLPPPDRVIDLTLPLGLRDNPAPGRLARPGVPAPVVPVVPAPPTPVVLTPVPAVPAPPTPPPVFVPAANPRPAPPEPAASPVAAPVTPAAGPLGNPSGSAAGDLTATGGGGTGGPGSRTRTVDVRPALLNPDEVYTNLQKFYPEAERAAKREARVVVKLALDAAGKVVSADVVNSGGAAFDSAARSVALRMRFSPAKSGGKPVPIAFLQAINFKLD